MPKILLFNPRSARSKCRIPNSVLQVAAAVDGRYDWVIVDGNREGDPYARIRAYLQTGEFRYVGFSVMPGPQLQQAIPLARRIRQDFPGLVMIWGGYFAANHDDTVVRSPWVDYVIRGPGDRAFPQLIDALEAGDALDGIPHLVRLSGGKVLRNRGEDLPDQDALPPLPYARLDALYPLKGYLGKTCLGRRTMAYHSSIGCPFTCAFCGVVPIYQARWKGKSADRIFADIRYVKERWGADAIEFHDNNFFVSEERTAAFSRLIRGEGMAWWGEGRIDTLDRYADSTLALMREAGCRMIFFGAESGNDQLLRQMNKGGRQSGAMIRRFAARLDRFGIIPEYSFVLGTPASSAAEAAQRIEEDIRFIREIKEINPRTEIVLYIYSPVPTEGSALYAEARERGFHFPETLEEWLSPRWENFDLHRNPLTPWLTPALVDRIHDFETVLNGYFPTVSDIRLNHLKKRLLRLVAGLRYRVRFYRYPYEIKLLQRLWRYRQPEVEGF